MKNNVYYRDTICELHDNGFRKFIYENILEATFLTFRTTNRKSYIFNNKFYTEEIITFFRLLWEDILLNAENLKRIIVIGCEPYEYITDILNSNNKFICIKPDETIDSGWELQTISYTKFSNGRKKLTVVRLPHLSRFRLFSNDKFCKKLETGEFKNLFSLA